MKKEAGLRRDDLHNYLVTLNPLALRDESGMLDVYSSAHSCYYEFVKRLWWQCPRGYIDPVVILCEWYDMSLHDAEREVVSWQRRFNGFSEPVIVEWSKVKETMSILRVLIQGVCDLLKVSFREDQFGVAMDRFFYERRDMFQS